MLNWLPRFGWLIALIDEDDDDCLSYVSPESEPNDPRWDDEGDPALFDWESEGIYDPWEGQTAQVIPFPADPRD